MRWTNNAQNFFFSKNIVASRHLSTFLQWTYYVVYNTENDTEKTLEHILRNNIDVVLISRFESTFQSQTEAFQRS